MSLEIGAASRMQGRDTGGFINWYLPVCGLQTWSLCCSSSLRCLSDYSILSCLSPSSNFISVAMIKHHYQKQYRAERVYNFRL